MLGTVEIIEDEDGCTPLDEETRERLEELGIPMCFDFLHNELHFCFGEEECALFDFEDFIIQEIDKQTFLHTYLSSSEETPEGLEETLEILQEHIDTNIYIVGEGWYWYLAIQLHNCYIVIGKLIIDIEDLPPDDDPDGGEPVPIPQAGIFLYTYLKWKNLFVTFLIFPSFYIDLGKIKPIIYTLFFNNFLWIEKIKLSLLSCHFLCFLWWFYQIYKQM